MTKRLIKPKYTCFIYGEGKRDKNFLITLFNLKKFQHHSSNWIFQYDSAWGGTAKNILEKCQKESSNFSFDLILCFIDLDKLKEDFPKTWKKEKNTLEEKYPKIKIIWQINNAEDEYKKVLGNIKSKKRINNEAQKQIEKFINSDFWKRILKAIKDKEKELKKTN